ncbi:MAG TPA: hypothetical protein VJ765_14835 [Chitinophagaceae bacterium]|nr:hypothetical protein [Chitinophagaceae bacterium]
MSNRLPFTIDVTNEEPKTIPGSGGLISAGGDASFTKYNLHTPQMMISILHTLSSMKDHVKY